MSKHSLGLFLEAQESPENFDWFVYDKDRDQYHKVKYIEDWCGFDNQFWLFGREYGPEAVVSCGGESSGHEAWLDELTPIPQDEVHEAYNAFDKLLEHMQSNGHENTKQLRSFCNRWCKFFFEMENADLYGPWELDESYQYQSNATDTGIVNVGHYEWMRQVSPEELFFQPK
ncbi:MAG: hypothetical protein CMK32_08250 [Porticoccaceae bacterium]|nr:hypothetical protein [Porticoccaceae bacterium]